MHLVTRISYRVHKLQDLTVHKKRITKLRSSRLINKNRGSQWMRIARNQRRMGSIRLTLNSRWHWLRSWAQLKEERAVQKIKLVQVRKLALESNKNKILLSNILVLAHSLSKETLSVPKPRRLTNSTMKSWLNPPFKRTAFQMKLELEVIQLISHTLITINKNRNCRKTKVSKRIEKLLSYRTSFKMIEILYITVKENFLVSSKVTTSKVLNIIDINKESEVISCYLKQFRIGKW